MKVARWFISPQIQAPLIGAFQDALIGLAELTKDGITFNKWHAMEMFADINSDKINYIFNKKEFSNRELVSRILPEINLTGKNPSMYKKNYAHLLKYNPADIEVSIVRGELKSGILDKATAGQSVSGSIFHIIANTFGNNVALDTVYNLQQIVHKFLLYHSFTVGIQDINISDVAMKEVKRRTAAMIIEARKITQRCNNGKLIPPIGMSLYNFYESEQITALTEGDDFVDPILNASDIESNEILRLILTGSKGKMKNYINLNGCLGVQTINGKRFGPQVGWGRSSPYYVRYDTEPDSQGFVSTSYREGVTPDVYAFVAGDARHGAISNALKTSVTGYQNRISIKNLESIMSDNLYKSTKNHNIVQPLYVECGLDPSKTEKVKFPTVLISTEKFTKTYKGDISKLDKKFQNPSVQKILDEEFKQLTDDRERYRRIHSTLENHNLRVYIMSNDKQMPVNVYRIIEDVIYNNAEIVEKLPKEERVLDPIYAHNLVKELCHNLGYAFMNQYQKDVKRKIPKHISTSTQMLQILIRSYLCMNYLTEKKIINHLLDIIVQKIVYTFKKSLIDAGTSVGILAAQCISEPMTQFVLDSKHRAGVGGTQTNAIVRLQEILGAKDTETMKNPHMLIVVKPEYEEDKLKVQEISNHIEMMTFNRFISSTRVFFEEYGKPVHPNYKNEAYIITQIEKHNFGQNPPGDLAKWCIRYEIDKEELILKSMKLETIILAIRKEHPELYIIYSPENTDVVFVRCYLRNSMFKQTNNYFEDNVLLKMNQVKEVIVRGVKDIISTEVTKIVKNGIEPDGSIIQKTIYGIAAVGTNISGVLNINEVDCTRTQTDSIEETENVYGIVAARNKIINEIIATMEDINRMHCSIFADEMCYSGQVTSIQRTGLQKREQANITLQISFQNQIQVITNAAVNGLVDRISGVSGPLIMGTNPQIGTCYNSLIVNEDFINQIAKETEDTLENL
jgi:DNA-directed RNA polymerase beta' subunit